MIEKELGKMLNIGEKAPSFKLDTVSSLSSLPIPTTLEDYKGKWLLLFFYPFDFSIVCPTEMKSLSSRVEAFREINTEVLAVSTDSIYTHRAWLKNEGGNGIGDLQFPLASDFSKKVAEAYGVLHPQTTSAHRATFIIDPDGIIQYAVMTNMNVGRSAEETLRVLAALQSGGMCPMDWKIGDDVLQSKSTY